MDLKEYKNHLIINGKSENTITDYLSKVKIFLKKVKEINQNNVNDFLLDIKTNKSANTYSKYLAVIKNYLKFKKIILELPSQIKIDKKLPETITKEYFENEVIEVVKELSTNLYRDISILYLMFYTGLRVSEIEKIYRKNINLDKREILITSPKGKSQWKVYIPKKVATILSSYFGIEAEETNAFNITTGGVKSMFKRYKPYLEDINFHPHLLRHSFATMYLENGGDIVYLSQIMGHKNLQTTMNYLNINPKKRKADYDKTIKG